MDKFLKYLEGSVSPFHTVEMGCKELRAAGFEELVMYEDWKLKENGKYFINHYGTTLVAFTVPTKKKMVDLSKNPVLKIAAAHTDFPCLKIKSNPDMKTDKYEKLNVEVYGGAILNTWLDRPLGIAGSIAVKAKTMEPKVYLYDSKRAVATIPNLAIHMNREVNKGIELNKQIDMIPVFAIGDEQLHILDFIAEDLKIKAEDIISFDLNLYNCDKPEYVGVKNDFISSPRIDNVSSCSAILEAFIENVENKKSTGVNVAIMFDHEEVGSRTKQGAGSALLNDVIEKIYESMGYETRKGKDAIYQGIMLSVDVAHAMHPNKTEKADVTNKPIAGYGVALKEASNQNYATDLRAIGIVKKLADMAGVDYQTYANRSDIPGGGTLGAISSALVPMKTVDIGVPILAMHSSREMMGEADYASLKGVLKSFYNM
ncbi:MAG: M18 family aminopeptidase [Lachnospiraceae bacterium]|nr:M18 family aminopeptidase [Lachnospiraceae bacterium]